MHFKEAPRSSLGVARGLIVVGNVQTFRVFLKVLQFPQFHPTNILHFSISLPPTSCHFIFSSINFMSFFTLLMVRKNNTFGAPSVYYHTGWLWRGRSGQYTMCFSIGL